MRLAFILTAFTLLIFQLGISEVSSNSSHIQQVKDEQYNIHSIDASYFEDVEFPPKGFKNYVMYGVVVVCVFIGINMLIFYFYQLGLKKVYQ